MLYSQEDFSASRRRGIIARWLTVLFCLLPFVAGLIPLLAGRQQLLSVLLSAGAVPLCLALYGTVCAPVLSYARFMFNAKENNRRDFQGIYHSQGEDATREGVRLWSYFFLEEGVSEPRKFYFDASLPPPQLVDGARYAITHTSNILLEIQPLS